MKRLTNFCPQPRTSRSKQWLWLLTCFTILLGGANSYAQVHTSIVGTGTGFNSPIGFPTPLGNYYWGNKNQFLVTAGELAASNMGVNAEISSVGFNVIDLNQVPTLENYVVKVYAVSDANPIAVEWYSGTPITQATVGNFTPASGWNQIELDSPFEWDGTSHLIIETCSQNSSWTSDGNASVEWTSGMSGATFSRWYRADNDSVCSSSTTTEVSTSTRPNIRFEWTGDLPECLAPSGLAIDGVSFSSADISWTSSGTLFDVEFGEAGFSPTGNPSPGYEGITNTYATLTGLAAETYYQYYVRQDCGDNSTSLWVGPYTFYTGYCIPTSTWDGEGNRIKGFSTTDGYTNISNENNGTNNAYSNFSNMSVTVSPGGTFYFSVTVPAWTYVEMWLDLDQNFIFDETMELVAAFEYSESPVTFTGSIMIPPGTPYGDYRLRIRSRSDYGTIATPCGELSYSEAEDYTVSVVPVPTCLPPSGLAVDGVSYDTADISWMSTGTLFDVEFVEVGSTPTGNPSPGYEGITNPYVTLTGLDAETYYYFYVRQDCGDGDTSLWAGPYPFYTGYCIPTSTWDGEWNRIKGFSTTDGYTNISNENNGTDNDYSNFSNMSVTVSPGGTFNYSVSVPGWTYVEMWLDLDQNFIFDETMELVAAFEYSESPVTFTGSIMIPPGTPYGDYRLRIRSREEWNTTASPCGEISYSEAEDYTVSVVPVPSCIPPSGLAVDGVSYDTADISWMSTGTLFDVEFGETGFTPTGNPSPGYAGITNPYVTLTGLDAETYYQFYVRQDCGDGDTSLWAGPYPFYTGYCVPTSTWDGPNNRIKGFSTTDGYTNISNENNGTDNDYSNFSNLSVTVSPGGTFNYSVSVPGWTYVEMWLDLDQNFIFDETMELIAAFEYSESPVTFTGSIMIPPGTPYGDYRLRIRSRSDYGTIATPCGELSYSEAEDYTVSVVPVPSCIPPNGLTVDGVSFNTADISWLSPGTLFDVEFGVAGFTPTGEPTPGYEGITNTYVTLTGLTPDTSYQFYVRQDCGDGDTSLWAGPFNFYTGYCQVTTTNTGDYISSFATTGAASNITYSEASYPGAYVNQSSQIIEQAQGLSFDFSSVYVGGGQTVNIWIDWNNDMVFDNSAESDEKVYSVYSSSTAQSGTILIPASVPVGEYRMRVRAQWGSGANPPPCGEVSWGSTVDFTLSVTAAPSCIPPTALTGSSLSLSSAEFSWTSDGNLFDLEWGVQGFTPGSGTLVSGITTTSYQLTDLTEGTTYEFYVRQDCGDGDTSIWMGPYAVHVGYCIPTFVNDCSSGDTIDNFVMAEAGINHIGSGCSPNNYGDFTNEPTLAGTMIVGETYDFEITHQYDFNQWVSIWIDLNSNGTFDADELLFTSSTYIENGITTGSITIPANAPTGTFRMRVLNHYGNYTENACDGASYGETHDYTVTITSPADPCDGITTPTGASEQIAIIGGTLANLTVSGDNLVWYADADLTTPLPLTTPLVDGTTYYVVSETDECQSEALAITVTVIDPCADVTTPTGDAVQTVAEGSTLADLTVNGTNLAWYADEALTQPLTPDTVVENGVTYYVASVTDVCISEALAITVNIVGDDPCASITVETPTGEALQTVTEGTILADLVVDGENLQWYADAELTQELDSTTVVEDGVTYYVTQTIGVCTSAEALAVTVQVTVGREDFDSFAFRFYPNPVGDVLNLSSNSEISNIDLFNMLGQKVTVVANANNTQVDMSALPTGNYIISITIEGVTKTFKVVKK